MKRITLSNRITSVLICICFIVTTVIGTVGNAIIANASLRVSAEELFGEGAMYLDEFLGQHPDALINGRPLIMPLAIGNPEATLGEGWFSARWKEKNRNSFDEPQPMSDFENAHSFGWTNPKSGGMVWGPGGLESSSGYPTFTDEKNGEITAYGVVSAYARDVRVYNVGLVELNQTPYLWVSVDDSGYETSAVVFTSDEDKDPHGQVTLNYGVIEFPLTYEVWVDGVKQLENDAVFGLDNIFGSVRSPYTQKQKTSFLVDIPKGYTADVSVILKNGTTKACYPDDWGGAYLLGTDPAYIDGRSGPNRFSLTETYNPDQILDAATIKVELKKRTSFTQNAQVWVNNTGHVSGIGNGTGEEVTYHDDGSYDWTFTFQVDGAAGVIGIGSKTYSLSTLYINGEMFNVPYLSFSDMVNKGVWKGGEYIPDSPDEHSTEAFLSSGERVKITITKAYDHASIFGDYGTYYYKVEIFGSYRDLIVSNGDIVENDRGSFVSFKRITTLNKVADGLSVKLYYRDNPYSNNFNWHTINKAKSVDTYKVWDPIGLIKVGRFVYGTGDSNGNISVTLNEGYVFPGAGKDDVSPDVIENAVRSWARGMDDTDGEIGSGYIGLKKGSDGSYYGLLNEDPSPDTFLKDSISYIDIETKPVQIKYNIVYQNGINAGSALNADNTAIKEKNIVSGDVPDQRNGLTRTAGSFNIGKLPAGTQYDNEENKYVGEYWVLTDKDGNPVDKEGELLESKDDWITFSDGDVGNVNDYIEYTHKVTDGFTNDTDGAPVHTIYLTAYWKIDTLITYTHYVTANISKDENGAERVRVIGEAYTREHKVTEDDIKGNLYPENKVGDILGAGKYKDYYEPNPIKAVYARSQFENPDDVTVDKDTIVGEFGEQGGVYKWYKLDNEKNPKDYVWEGIWDQDEVDVWFSRNLGGMTFTNKIDGAEYSGIDKALPFTITFDITKDERFTAGNELNFFEEAADLGVLPEGCKITKIKDGTWEAKFKLANGESITFPYLPTDMTYEIELDPTPGYRMHNADGVYVCSKSVQKHYGGTVGVVEDFGGMKKEVEREYFKGKVESYDDQKVEITVFGTYLIDLEQAWDDPTTQQKLTYGDTLEVENFHHLYYQATVQNLTSKSQTISTVIDVDNGGGRLLNIESILEEPISWNPEDIPPNGIMTGVKDGVSWVYDRDKGTITFTETIEPGGERTYEIVNSIPAVDGETIYTATANLQDSVGNDIEADQPELKDGKLLTTPKDKPQVTAYAYSYWLRILAYCDDDPNAVFTIKTGLTGTFNYYLFENGNTYGQGNGIPGTTSGEITLKHGQRVVIYGLEVNNTSYEVTSNGLGSNGKQYAVYSTGTNGSITPDDIDMAIFRFVPTKKLTVTKTVLDENGDHTTGNFAFTATLTPIDANDSSGNPLTLDPSSIEWDESLQQKNNWTTSNTWSETGNTWELLIPDGSSYEIKEDVVSGYITSYVITDGETKGDTVFGNAAYGTINGNDVTVDYTNTKGSGVVISKTVAGSLLEGDKDTFDFKITFSGRVTLWTNFTAKLKGKDADGNDLLDTDIKFVKSGDWSKNGGAIGSNLSGSATFSLKNGQYVMFEAEKFTGNLSVTVEEITKDSNFTTKINGEPTTDYTTTFNYAANYICNYTNTRNNGNLTIEKVVENDPKDKNTEFKFDVTLKKANGDLLGTKNDGSKYVFGGVEFDENGKGVVTVKANDSFTIEGIPTGLTYEVTEQNMDGYTQESLEYQNTDRTITNGVTDEVICVNTALTHSLTIKNIVKGNMASLQQEFPFEIKLFDNDGELLTGVFQIIITNGGDTISDNNYVVNGSSGIIRLKHGDILTIVGLPPEITYEITEIDKKGYDVEINVTPSDDDVKIVDNTASGTLNGNVIVTFTNELDGNIPTGVDTEQGWLISMFILTAFGALVIFLKRRIDKTGGRPP